MLFRSVDLTVDQYGGAGYGGWGGAGYGGWGGAGNSNGWPYSLPVVD